MKKVSLTGILAIIVLILLSNTSFARRYTRNEVENHLRNIMETWGATISPTPKQIKTAVDVVIIAQDIGINPLFALEFAYLESTLNPRATSRNPNGGKNKGLLQIWEGNFEGGCCVMKGVQGFNGNWKSIQNQFLWLAHVHDINPDYLRLWRAYNIMNLRKFRYLIR